MKSYVVIGLGRFGASLARQLCKLGAEVLALDVKGDLVQQVASEVTHAVVGDAQDKEVLRALGVRNMDCAIIAIGDNLAASVLITMNLKELGIPFIVCKAHDETHRKVLEKLGVDRVVIPEQEYAQRLARTLNSHNVLDYIELSEDFGILDVPCPRRLAGEDPAGAEYPGQAGREHHRRGERQQDQRVPRGGLRHPVRGYPGGAGG